MIVDTGVVVERVREGRPIPENIVEVSLLEYPAILLYDRFTGLIYRVRTEDLATALELQLKLRRAGKVVGLAELLIAAVAVNRGEELVTRDRAFLEIAGVSKLKVRLLEG